MVHNLLSVPNKEHLQKHYKICFYNYSKGIKIFALTFMLFYLLETLYNLWLHMDIFHNLFIRHIEVSRI